MVAMLMFDVVEEILLRLHVKDLLRCKSVCKSWYSLISSPLFIKTHEKIIRNNDHKNNKQLGSRRIAQIRPNGTMRPEWIYPILFFIEGSSNGLVCISSSRKRVSLTNPWTREFRNLHKPPIHEYENRCYGFGYDSSIDNCKLVMAIIIEHWDSAFVQILSLKSNRWKRFGFVNYIFHDWTPGILCSGALHWFWFDANDINSENGLIVSFDLAKEEFIEIPQPDDTRYVWSSACRLKIIEDQLCIFQPHNNGRPKSIWVMRNYNVKPCWELLPDDYEMKDNVVHYMKVITDCDNWKKPTFFCDDNTIYFSRDTTYFGDPLFVQTLVSPYPINGKSSHTKIKNRGVKENRDIEEVYDLKDEETKKKRKDSRNIKKSGSKENDEILSDERDGGKKKRKRNTNKSNN